MRNSILIIILKKKNQSNERNTGVTKRLSKLLSRHSLLLIYKWFVRPHLDYGDILYDQPNNKSLCQKIKTVQYNAALAITSAIKGTPQIKLYTELGLESLEFRWWFRKLCFIRLKKLVYQNIYWIWYHKATIGTTLDWLRMLQHFTAEQMYSNILISHIPF